MSPEMAEQEVVKHLLVHIVNLKLVRRAELGIVVGVAGGNGDDVMGHNTM